MSHTPFLLGGIGSGPSARPCETFLRIAPGFRCVRDWSSASLPEATRTTGALSRLAADVPAGVPAASFWSYSNVGWCLLGRAIETATDASWEDAMRRHLASMGMRETTFASSAVTKRRASGHEITAEGPVPVGPLAARAYGPAGTTAVSTVTDLLRFAAVHLEDSSLAALRGSARGSVDPWLAGLLVSRLGQVRLGGWSGLGMGRRRQRRTVFSADHAGTSGRHRADDERQHRACDVSLALRRSDEIIVRHSVPPLRLDPSTGAAGDLSRFAGVYAWPDRRVEVTAAGSRLLIESEQGGRRRSRSTSGPSSSTRWIRTTPR